MNQPDIISYSESPDDNMKYKKSPLTVELKKYYLNLLLKYMEENKPYMNSTITIGYLSNGIGIKLNYLSQIINELLNKNFYEFINDYRIKAAIEMMSNQKYKKKSIENILYEVGYNSRSTFFSIFKAKTGMTPKIFRKKLSS